MRHILQAVRRQLCSRASRLISAHVRPAQAQDFSNKPIRIIVGLVAGGATDVTARLVAQKLTESLHTNVYVENRPGAAFEPALRELTGAPPDGHTLFMISASVVVTQPFHKDYPFDLAKMTPVDEVSNGPFILVSRKTSPFKNVNDLVAYGKANPGKLTFGSGGGAGSSLYFAAELLRLRSGISIVNVPTRAPAASLNDLLGSHIDAMFDAMPVEVGQVKAGNVVGLAVTSAKRSPALPDVPTMVESGYKDFVVDNYFGLLARAGHAAGDRQEAARRGRQGGGDARTRRPVQEARHGAGRQRAGRVRQADQVRARALDARSSRTPASSRNKPNLARRRPSSGPAQRSNR